MAPNNALGKPTAAAMRSSIEGSPRSRRSPARRGRTDATKASDDLRIADQDGFGAGEDTSVVGSAEVAARGVGSLNRTPLDEFEALPRDELKYMWTCVMFLTRLPCPGWCDHHPGCLMRGMAYFPFIGMLIGVWAAAIYDAAASMWPPLVAAALSSGGTLWLTGCFHEDGLCVCTLGLKPSTTAASATAHPVSASP